jgi:biopolymer transport protein ExbB
MIEVLQDSYDYLLRGGWVMVPLLLCSLVMWTLIAERLRTFRLMTHDDITTELAIRAVQGEEVNIYVTGLRAELVKAFMEQRSGNPALDREILRQCALNQRPGLSQNLAAIGVLAAVAPLLGLLGTVLGMIETFDVISFFGTGNAKAMAGGISVALVTTQTGLIVAIPGLFLSGVLTRRAHQLGLRLDEVTTVLDRVVKRVPDRKGGTR